MESLMEFMYNITKFIQYRMTTNKIFIIYHNEDIINQLIDKIYTLSNEINICDKFTTNINDIKNGRPYSYYYLNTLEVNKAIKNNYLLYVITNNYISTGITFDNFYNSDICCLNYKEYNTIPDNIFNKHNILTIWVDSSKNKYEGIHNDIVFIEKRLEKVDNEYFLDNEIEEIINTILNYLDKDNNI